MDVRAAGGTGRRTTVVTGFAHPSHVGQTWADFIRGSASCAHGVQIYADVDELAASVATYFAAGFAAAEPGLVVATAAHRAHFAERLAAAGWDSAGLEREGLLVTA